MSQGVPAHPCFVKSEQTVSIGKFWGAKKASWAAVQVAVDLFTENEAGRNNCARGNAVTHLPCGRWSGGDFPVAVLSLGFYLQELLSLHLLSSSIPLWFLKLVIIYHS